MTPRNAVERLISYNPATGDPVGTVPIHSVTDIDKSVARARHALPDWRSVPLPEKATLLRRAARRLAECAQDLGELLSTEMGKPLRQGEGEVTYCSEWIESKIDEMVQALHPQRIQDDKRESTIYFDPFGVAGVISPWNFPMSMPQWMVVPALMAGNTVVLKPSEETPLIAQAYVDTLNEALPANVLQIVHGADEQGKALVTADVQFIAFTGSRAVGKHILSRAAEKLTRVVLELGGKDPLLVLDDADIGLAARYAADNGFSNAGQTCVSVERVYCAEEIAKQFEDELTERARELKVGRWDEAGVEIGPMINVRQRDHVLAQINEAIELGAKALCGGGKHPDRYVLPTVLTQVSDDMSVMRDETFGPVVAVTRFDDIDEAVQRINDNPYALGGAVFGANEVRALAVARRLESGMIGINQGVFGAQGFPWVGAKQSGYGFHGSIEGHRQFAQRRVVSRTLTS